MSKKHYIFLRVHLFGLQNEGDRSLQHKIEGIINMMEGITIRSKKQTSVLIFFHHKVFYITFLRCTGVQKLKVLLF